MQQKNIFKIGDSVAIFGDGPISLLTLMASKVADAPQIIVSDLSKDCKKTPLSRIEKRCMYSLFT